MAERTITDQMERALRALDQLHYPSLEEWATACGVPHGSMGHIRKRLQEESLISFAPGKLRTTYITDRGRQYLAECE